jgi:hypothetical protein
MLKAAWRAEIVDHSQLNSEIVEEVLEQEFEDMFLADEELTRWDEEDAIWPNAIVDVV